ncbi:MAG: PEGA domain-containing protein [Phycisphaerae bacterium]|nr:PEGA domain-containing protein [Phycisphaerae bacterium]
MKYNKIVQLTITAACLLALNGCVERLITITSQPAGAAVWLNGQEVGATPVTVPFTFYGTYDVTLRKDGCQTLNQPKKTPVPFYQWPGIDLVAECLIPAKFTDQHTWHFQLESNDNFDTDKLIDRAKTLRQNMTKTP